MTSTPFRIVAWGVTAAVLVALPFGFPAFRVEQFIGWMSVAVAAAGLNLLTGYNGQISVGHGALYGIGAYTVALLVTDASWPLGPRSARRPPCASWPESPSACRPCASRASTSRW